MFEKSKGFLTMDPNVVSAKTQLAVGAGLAAAPLWVTYAQNISIVAAMIAGVCGAILGVHAVFRLFVGSKPPE